MSKECVDFQQRYSFRYRTNRFLLLGVERDLVNESLDSPQIQSIVGRTLLIETLKEMQPNFNLKSPIAYRYGPFGKPYLVHYPDLFFNISHCKDAVVCVLAKHEIGVDVETVIPLERDLMKTVLNTREIAEVLDSSEPERTFTQLWTRKESLIKYLGIGLNDDIKNILDEYSCSFFSYSKSHYEICVCCP